MDYYSESRECPKCAETSVSTRWVPGELSVDARLAQLGLSVGALTAPANVLGVPAQGRPQFPSTKPTLREEEHEGGMMVRQCSRCGFSWKEIPLDRMPALQRLGSIGDGAGEEGE